MQRRVVFWQTTLIKIPGLLFALRPVLLRTIFGTIRRYSGLRPKQGYRTILVPT